MAEQPRVINGQEKRPNRGLHLMATPRLREHLTRYQAFRTRLEADRRAWPRSVNAAEHVADVIAEIEAELAARAAGVAA
ncbi:MAG: hypothetical protein M3Q10_01095 [Chloroflexota bacterium]|nr:hypothetical protein [Chloroflexota bacterium]